MAKTESSKKDAKPPLTAEGQYAELLDSLVDYELEPAALGLLEKAYRFAADKHKHQTRQSGEPYITHPLAVAQIVTTIKLDLASVIAAILHDTVEDTECTLTEIEAEFGREVSYLVDGLTKISKIKFRSNQEKLAENFRKMILAMAKDLRVILVKLCDRLHNMRTITHLSDHKRRSISQETLDIYAPLANRLGIYGIKSELEDLCLRHLKQEVYFEIRNKIAGKKSERQAHIAEVISILEAELQKYGFKELRVYGRPKHFYSIYKKMVERHVAFEDIHDLFAFRIVVNSIKDCYEALGVVHAMWKPMPGRFKDYIAMPKANLYQSLHTTVVRPSGEPAEIQIRTKEMHETCEFGVAAHWAYKEQSSENLDNTDLEKFSWLRQIVQWQNELKDPVEFLEAVKVDLFDDEIFVFTPKGDVLSLPQKASALDFAFAVHTDIGLKTIGAKVNSRIAPIKKRLESGDIVEILMSPNQKPSKDWLNFVVTSKARNKIRSYLRSEQREKSRKIGRDIIIQELERAGHSFVELEKSGQLEKLVRFAKESNFDDLTSAVGYGKINAAEVIKKAFPDQTPQHSITEQVRQSGIGTRHPAQRSHVEGRGGGRSGILVSGYGDVLVQFGKCCCPLPGEDVVGFITRGRGVSVHRSDCARALDLDPERRIPVEWEGAETPSEFHKCFLSILTRDKPGVLAEVTSAISECGVNVQKAEVKITDRLTGILDFELGVRNKAQLEKVMLKLEGIPSVVSIKRRNILKRRVRKKLGR